MSTNSNFILSEEIRRNDENESSADMTTTENGYPMFDTSSSSKGANEEADSKPSVVNKVKKRRKWKKPKGKPKRPLSAYNLYFAHVRQNLMKKGLLNKPGSLLATSAEGSNYKTEKKSKKQSNFAGLARTIAAAWKSLDAAEKVHFQEKALVEQERYKVELRQWKLDVLSQDKGKGHNNDDMQRSRGQHNKETQALCVSSPVDFKSRKVPTVCKIVSESSSVISQLANGEQSTCPTIDIQPRQMLDFSRNYFSFLNDAETQPVGELALCSELVSSNGVIRSLQGTMENNPMTSSIVTCGSIARTHSLQNLCSQLDDEDCAFLISSLRVQE